jgi:hypothetical protein
MTPSEISKRLGEIDPMAAAIILEAQAEARKITPECLLPDVVIMIMATSIADQRRKIMGLKANSEGRLAAIASKQ